MPSRARRLSQLGENLHVSAYVIARRSQSPTRVTPPEHLRRDVHFPHLLLGSFPPRHFRAPSISPLHFAAQSFERRRALLILKLKRLRCLKKSLLTAVLLCRLLKKKHGRALFRRITFRAFLSSVSLCFSEHTDVPYHFMVLVKICCAM